MRRTDVSDFDLSRFDGFGQRNGFDRIFAEKTFDGLAGFRIAGAAVVRFEFEAVETWRIVAGSDHHAADGVQLFHGEGNRRRRRRFRREDNLKIVSGKNFRRDLREAVGKKPAVVTDNNFRFMPEDFRLGIGNFRLPKVRRRLHDARNIGEREILRDHRAPAIRAEFDWCHAPSLSAKKSSPI